MENFKPTLAAIVQTLDQHLKSTISEKKPTVCIQKIEDLAQKLESTYQKEGLIGFIQAYLEESTKLQSPKFIGHQTGLPTLDSCVADLVTGVINNSVAVTDMGPPGIALEKLVLQKVAEHIGFEPQKSGGILTHGGSLANFTALLAARAKFDPNAWENGTNPKLVGLVPKVAHYCVSRVFSMMGLGSKAIVEVETDSKGKIKIEPLHAQIRSLKDQGLIPFVLVGTAGSTATGCFDDLNGLSVVSREHGIWLHVDGAHGASALFSTQYRNLCSGIEKADSVVWDFHKLGGTSSLCTVLLYRSKNDGQQIFHQDASYLAPNTQHLIEREDLFPLTVECTKPAISLKAFLVLRKNLERAQYIDQVFGNTRKFATFIKNHPDFEIPFEPESNILLFRKIGAEDHYELYQKVLLDGEYHITYANWRGKPYLRLTVINPGTQQNHIEGLLRKLNQIDS